MRWWRHKEHYHCWDDSAQDVEEKNGYGKISAVIESPEKR
jgi:hypothetical protein